MAVANIVTILQGQYGVHNTSGSLAGTQPPIASADWLQLSKKYSNANHLLDAAAATASEDGLLTVTPNYASGIKIWGVWAITSAAVVFNAANFATLQLGTRPQAGGGAQTTTGFTALTTAAVSWAANQLVALFTSTVGVAIAQNLGFTCAITKSGTGVVIPQLTYMVEWSEA